MEENEEREHQLSGKKRKGKERRTVGWKPPRLPCRTLERPKSVLREAPPLPGRAHPSSPSTQVTGQEQPCYCHSFLIRFHIFSSCKHNLTLKLRYFKGEGMEENGGRSKFNYDIL
jgi:hypothetical protein